MNLYNKMQNKEYSQEDGALMTIQDMQTSFHDALKYKTALFTLTRSTNEHEFQMKELCGETRENRRKVKEWNEQTDAFLEKINALLDFDILKFEVRFFKCLYFAVIILFVSMIVYNRYLNLYYQDQRSTSYHDFLTVAEQNVIQETLGNKHSFLSSQEFTRKCMDNDHFMKYMLVRYKYRNNSEVLGSLSSWRLKQVQNYLTNLADAEVNRIFEGDQDWGIMLLVDWIVIGFILHAVRNKLINNHIRSLVEKFISAENKAVFCKKNRAWLISSDLRSLSFYELNTKDDQEEEADELDNIPECQCTEPDEQEEGDSNEDNFDADNNEDIEEEPNILNPEQRKLENSEKLNSVQTPEDNISLNSKSSHNLSKNSNKGDATQRPQKSNFFKGIINKLFSKTTSQAINIKAKDSQEGGIVENQLNVSEMRDLNNESFQN